jgi:membrane-bound lytic murein transglycosylase B
MPAWHHRADLPAAAVPESVADLVGVADPGSRDEPIRAPGLGAALRRHPKAVRTSAAGAIACGAVLFVVASVTTQVAGADTAGHAAARVRPVSTRLGLQDVLPGATTTRPLAPVAAVAAVAAPAAPAPAPADAAAISDLAANGIPNTALNAYRVAAARLANATPGCGLDWALLAGIGRVESDHGRFGGAVLHTDGTSTPRTIGPALDGKRWDYIPAPANGMELDGDAVYAHALGPMQFIPSTWAAYGADANGDGVADIFNINDAALGAARYLCAAGGNLRSADGQVRAVRAYNNNDGYLAEVLALADAYRRGIPISGIPVGNTTGALPPVKGGGTPPPANPGPAPAAGGGNNTPATTTQAGSAPAAGGSSTGSGTGGSTGSGTASGGGTAPVGGQSSVPATTTTSTPTTTTTSPTPTPTPSPTKSCSVVNQLLHQC